MTPTKPSTVAAVRGLLYAALAAIVSLVVALTPAEAEQLGPWAPVLLLVARFLEAKLLDRRAPLQSGPLGGGPA